MRTLVLALTCVSMISSATASFELLLVCDFNNHEIDRYDANSGVYLGSFGNGYLGFPTSISVDPSTGLGYVLDSNSLRTKIFNYNTGDFVGSYANPGGTLNWFNTRLNNGQMLQAQYGTTNAYRVDTSGNILQTLTPNGCYTEGLAQTADNFIWALDTNSNRLFRATTASTTLTPVYNITGGNQYEYLASQGNSLAAIQFSSGTTHILKQFTSTAGVITSESSVNLISSAAEINGGVVFGHDGTIYALTTGGNTSYLHTTVRGDSFSSRRPLSQTTYAQGMAIVLAPEPVSMISLAIPLVGLIIRRRRQS